MNERVGKYVVLVAMMALGGLLIDCGANLAGSILVVGNGLIAFLNFLGE